MDSGRSQFKQIETIFKNAGGVPHTTGKYFGMGRDDNGLIQPFMNVGPHDVFSENLVLVRVHGRHNLNRNGVVNVNTVAIGTPLSSSNLIIQY